MKKRFVFLASVLLLWACMPDRPRPMLLPLKAVSQLSEGGFHIQNIPPDTDHMEATVFDGSNRQLTRNPVVIKSGQTNKLDAIPSGENRKIIVRAYDREGKVVAYGEKSGITVLPGEGTPTQTIKLSSLILEELEANPVNTRTTALGYTLDLGTSTTQKQFKIKSTGDYALPWTLRNVAAAGDNVSWLGANNASGGETWRGAVKGVGNDLITVNVDRPGLAFGPYSRQLKITSDKTSQELVVNVKMEVTGSGTPTGAGTGSMTGKVVERSTGAPITGAMVSVSLDGEQPLTVFTNATGDFTLNRIPEGTQVVIIAARGKTTRLEVTIVTNQIQDMGRIELDVNTDPPVAQKPVIRITQPADSTGNIVTGVSPLITIAGTIQNIDTHPKEAIISINGEKAKVSLNSDNSFSHAAILTQTGLNRIFIIASNSLGTTRSQMIEVTYKKPDNTSEIGVHVQLIWDTQSTDIDLHVLNPNGAHSYYMQKAGIPNGQLDVDDTDGIGPENFTMGRLPTDVPGRYKVGVIYYAEHGRFPPDTNCVVNITLKSGSRDQVVKRYQKTLTYGVGGGAFPSTTNNSTWRVADFIVNSDGTVQITAPSDEFSIQGLLLKPWLPTFLSEKKEK